MQELDLSELAGVEELETDVVVDTSGQFRLEPEEPVCVFVVGEHGPAWAHGSCNRGGRDWRGSSIKPARGSGELEHADQCDGQQRGRAKNDVGASDRGAESDGGRPGSVEQVR